jgi:ABC-2 type transport system permease protein
MLSGLSFPVEGFSPFYKLMSTTIPSTPGINGFVKLTQMEASFLEVLKEWNHLWILTFVYFVIAAISLKVRAKKELILKKV